jgi:hypothetical protein
MTTSIAVYKTLDYKIYAHTIYYYFLSKLKVRRGHDHMVVGFTTTNLSVHITTEVMAMYFSNVNQHRSGVRLCCLTPPSTIYKLYRGG